MRRTGIPLTLERSNFQTNEHSCLRVRFLMPDWLFPCNTITFQKYFWCSWFSWLLLSYLLLIWNYHLILFKSTRSLAPSHIHCHSASPPSRPPFLLFLKYTPTRPLPYSQSFCSPSSPPRLPSLFSLPPLWFFPFLPWQSRFLWRRWPQAQHLTVWKQRKRIN